MSTWLTGERSSPRRTIASNSSRLYAMPPPLPPSVNAGRMIAGKPAISSTTRNPSSIVVAMPPLATLSPMRRIASLNSARSSAVRIARSSAPISSTPYFSSTPFCDSAIATLSAVWPPIVGSSASGRSFSITSSTNRGVTGSTYVASANSGSVMMVAGFELMRITSYPSSFKAFVAWVPE